MQNPPMHDPIGTYEPSPEGAASALGHREDPHMVSRLYCKCYYQILALGDQARALYAAKLLFDQMAG